MRRFKHHLHKIKRKLLRSRQKAHLKSDVKLGSWPRLVISNLWVDENENTWVYIRESKILCSRLYGISPRLEILDRNAQPMKFLHHPAIKEIAKKVITYKNLKMNRH
jgi:hypothetical protein